MVIAIAQPLEWWSPQTGHAHIGAIGNRDIIAREESKNRCQSSRRLLKLSSQLKSMRASRTELR
jgi:hypothetical protein